jgi:ubiquinone/menaquinone biosynthesis C-methylase UbiE
VTHERDISAFDRRAATYDDGALGRLHHQLAERTVAAALDAAARPGRVLDLGCGTGAALRVLAARLPDATTLLGIDPAPAMVRTARSRIDDPRVRIAQGTAETLPVDPGSFDLIVTVTSFDHWADQQAGLRQCARALRSGGVLVLTDLFSTLLLPTMLVGRRGRARTVRTATARLRAAGFADLRWQRGTLIKTVVAALP